MEKDWNFNLSVISLGSTVRRRVRAHVPNSTRKQECVCACVCLIREDKCERWHAPEKQLVDPSRAAARDLASSHGWKGSLLLRNSPEISWDSKTIQSKVFWGQLVPRRRHPSVFPKSFQEPNQYSLLEGSQEWVCIFFWSQIDQRPSSRSLTRNSKPLFLLHYLEN